ncbi:TonB-dependent receptor [Sphingomonas sp.]|uniref:TonB-dependent receptor domain-containing protein n=1 Tax=Sphingomonas sp. TaxID=28214 RepID=UPI001B069EB5|nr:TonB-dependent receptor [Sphingomonas sp.]MBO9713871.1 TonB-dependent receptor [Sphingomonas sp.]
MQNKTMWMTSAAMAALLAAAVPAQAQDAPADSGQTAESQPAESQDDAQKSEIVVTGTLIRGIAPTGTQVIGKDREEILASGAASTTDVLASIPQLNYFGSVPRANQDAGSPVFYPNLRNLGASGGQDTLLLVNGHRMVGQGIQATTADPTVIPPAVLQRVDVIPDGGSSIYGSDAIGGVINFVTRKRFDGVEAASHYSTADHYDAVDADLTVGKDWGSGSLYVAYAYAWHSDLLGQYRDYATSNHLAAGGSDLRNTACAPGNLTVGGVTYALPGRVAGTLNRCDDPKVIDLYPREQRNSVFASFDQQLSPSLEFNATAYWSRRDTTVKTAQSTSTGTITALNPYFSPIGAETSQSVAFSWSSVFGPSNVTNQRFDSYGTTQGLTWDVGGGWQIRAESNFGRSESTIHEDGINATAAALALAGTSTTTALNPYNLGATNPAVLAAVENWENYSYGVQELAEGRVVADGTLFALPGGDVRLAAGGEYHYNNLRQMMVSGPRGTTAGATRTYSSRTVKSVFGEIAVPLFGASNGMPGLRSLTLSGSVRYDDYNDVGGTTNPKVGVTWEPFDDLKIRGNWGTSFHAPGLESISPVGQQAQILPVSPYIRPGDSALNFLRPTIVLAGGNPGLKPETADTWSVGADWKPKAIPGLLVSATYYKIDFKSRIGLLSATTLFTDPNFAPFYIVNPTLAQAQALTGGMTVVGAPSVAALFAGAPGSSPYLLADARLQNFGGIKVKGIDFHFAYAHQFGEFGLLADWAGTWTLDRLTATGTNGPWTDTLKNGTADLSFVAMLGGKFRGFTARGQFNYRGGYPILGLVNQTRIGAFETVDLHFAYDLPAKGWLKDTQLMLNVDNVFDVGPPYANVSNTNFSQYNGSTLGRLFQFGVRKTF